MLRSRLIPCLLIHKNGLYKTVGFSRPQYIGDPLNAVRIFNEKEVDELVVLDIDASRLGREPNYKFLAKLASECRMPLCYGGGVKAPEQFDQIVELGIEKVAISAAAVDNPVLVTQAASRVGSQSVVVVIDVKKTGLRRRYEVVTLNAARQTGLQPATWAKRAQELGAGEIVLNSVDRDGSLSGYDFTLIDLVTSAVSVPLTVLGGAGSLEDIRDLINRYGIIGAAAGSVFVLRGKYRAVLISYPGREEKNRIY